MGYAGGMPTNTREEWNRDNPVRYIRLPSALQARLTTIAARERRSFSAQLVYMLEQSAMLHDEARAS